ncbi:cytochrome P450 [Winogradskya humida]|uniref:Cytochrome P450 n=1 Tax=Winogradskya humida TaxID=113566 RepID=A0ABQ4A2F2_9ACTN|nr:cytochrome P450 [Actinoplanes humidus]GIE24894.1 cytochrome P450 [Actinoplanes humidus]
MHLEPFGDIYGTDPAAVWRRLLDSGEHVAYDDELDLWLIAGHDLARSVLADTRRFSVPALTPMQQLHPRAAKTLTQLDAPPVIADPPLHARTRAALIAVFATTSTRAEQLWADVVRRRAEQLADHLAHQVAATPWPDVDLVELFCSRFPLYVMLDVLGIPADDMSRIAAWADNFTALTCGRLDDDDQISAANGLLALWDFCRDLVVLRAGIHRNWQPHGLIGDLLSYRDGDDHRLTLPETSALVLTLLVAGWESTAAAVGHALEHGLRDRDRWAQLAVDEHYAAVHTEETLRHSPAIDGQLRITTTDVDLDGTLIPAGSRCLVLIGAANHDPRVFDQPATFQPGRARLSQQLGFGAGAHYCVGAALARIEITTALSVLARRLPDLTLAAGYDRRFRPSVSVRQHTALPATIAVRCPVAHGTLPPVAQP